MSKLKNRQAICSRPIVLIGMMGAGKSSLGLRLAEALKLPFLDADAEIEKAAAMSIAEIFEQHGETAFRDGERRVIKRLLDTQPMVLALGGGAFMNDATRALVQEKALSIWLDVPVDELVARVRNVVQRQERLLKEAARYADTDLGQMAKQIGEIRTMLQGGAGKAAGQSVEHSFTPREASVLQLVAEGLMNKEIARQLETSTRNVEKYVSRLFAKTGTASRTELVRYALEHGLVH